ncbi:MAG: hypothetical protein IBX68_07915 [Dehalococcoidia bacterium]|nr:hypothetical protein [Dehalococcoidia bacterium]
MWNAKTIGIIVALAIGFAWIWLGPLNAFFLGLFILGGWLIAKIVTGEIDILGFVERQSRSRRRG